MSDHAKPGFAVGVPSKPPDTISVPPPEPPPAPPSGSPGENGSKPPPGLAPPGSRVEQAAAVYVDSFIKGTAVFADQKMGSTLFMAGLSLLVFDIFVRLAQWAVNLLLPGAATKLDDVLFLALLGVSILMMAGGLISNLYLIWSLQRTQTAATAIARASVRETAILDDLKAKSRDQATVES